MRILLAPMEGLLDYMLRDALTADAAGGVDLCVAEFIRITDTLLPVAAFHRVVPELRHGSRTHSGVPVRVQLLGSDPSCMADNAARAAELGAYGIDLNFGCPANTVNRHRGGAILLREPEHLQRIVAAVRAAVPGRLMVTAKMRLGYDTPDFAIDCAQALASGGAGEIAVHARTKTDGYKPPAYWEWIARIREAVAVNVVANGEIWNPDDARRCREISGCADIMIGRGMVANPALARMIRGDVETLPPWSELLPVLHDFWDIVERNITPRHRNGRVKQWLLYLSRNYPEAQGKFDEVRRITDPEALRAMLFDPLLRSVAGQHPRAGVREARVELRECADT